MEIRLTKEQYKRLMNNIQNLGLHRRNVKMKVKTLIVLARG
jgi:hypothetical protein